MSSSQQKSIEEPKPPVNPSAINAAESMKLLATQDPPPASKPEVYNNPPSTPQLISSSTAIKPSTTIVHEPAFKLEGSPTSHPGSIPGGTMHQHLYPPSNGYSFPFQPQMFSQAPISTGPPEKVPNVIAEAHRGNKNLNVKDALSYLDEVKNQFSNRPEIYNRFLDIMKDFKSHIIDTPGVIERVSSLFRGHPRLINGFNTFLPPGYHIEASENPMEPIKVTTPAGHPPVQLPPYQSMTSFYPQFQQHQQNSVPQIPNQATGAPGLNPNLQYDQAGHPHSALPPVPVLPQQQQPSIPKAEAPVKRTIEFNQAINYVNKIKNRFSNEPETYKQFLEILQMYQKESKPVQDVYSHINVLFKNAPDLLEEFKQFLPDTSANNPPPKSGPLLSSISQQPKFSGPIQPHEIAKRPSFPPQYAQPKKRIRAPVTTTTRPVENNKAGTMEELEFFDRVKRAIGNKTSYTEFLKILNLFSQEIIDNRVLIERVTPFLEKSPDLLDWFKKFVKYEEETFLWNMAPERPVVDLKSCKSTGYSYRLLPESIAKVPCSSRDSLCNEVLNDYWISHPVYVSETGFIAHKKNIYEEALYKCEEERYEFDRNIEANLHTIALLEPIAKKISSMSPEERVKFKMPVGLGGTSKTIYQRVIKKIYDKERGQEVIDALHNNPATAVPVVLKRLKQKDEEWKRAQREWNRVWRDIDFKNYYKALDHQGINFKFSDRKNTSAKNLVSEIESILKEQKEKESTLMNRYQLDFAFKDAETFLDTEKIIITSIENSASISQNDEDKIKQDLLRNFIPQLFHVKLPIDDERYDIEEGKDEEEEENIFDSPKQSPKPAGLGITHTNTNINNISNTNGNVDDMISEPVFETATRPTYSCYLNTNLYVLIRLYQMLYSRLLKMKELSKLYSNRPPRAQRVNQIAQDLGVLKNEQKEFTFDEKNRYQCVLKSIEELIDGKLDNSEFEEQCRSMFLTSAYLVYTVDKLAQSIAKQFQTVLSDPRSLELINLYYHDRKRNSTSSRQEAIFRLTSECHVDDNLYRFEFFVAERVCTIQIFGKDEQFNDDSITSEEKWSLYVDHFVQLSATEGVRLKRREPFLKRNLPETITDEPPINVETKSGLELKICVNTYKIFFVDNTEDFFRRKNHNPTLGIESEREKRNTQFVKWHESEYGWRKPMNSRDPNLELEVEELMGGEGMNSKVETSHGMSYRRFKYGLAMPFARDDMDLEAM